MRTQSLNDKIKPQEHGYLTLVSHHIKTIYEISDYSTIGRDENSQIAISDTSVSNRHARIEKRTDGYFIKDLRSRNGTYLNGAKVLEAKLQDNDRLRLGLTEFVFTTEKEVGLLPVFTTSRNPDWGQQLKRIPAIAQSPHPVLLLGPSGTGKEILASMIHKLSGRSKEPFISVNCSALTEALAESELFGHKKGAFTGATDPRVGAFDAANVWVWWVVPEDEIIRSDEDDIDSLFAPAIDKTYRQQTHYGFVSPRRQQRGRQEKK